jgi:hypothetical protein
MGKKATIQFIDVPYATDFFGMTMSGGPSASYELSGIPWDSSVLTPGPTTSYSAQVLYNYINSTLPIGTDIIVTLDNSTVNLFSESCTSVIFYNTNGDWITLVSNGNLDHNGFVKSYANVSSQAWSGSYSVGSNILNLTWSGASDPEESIRGYDLSYKKGNSSTWISLGLIETSDGGASYDFTISQQVTHVFRVRTVDTTNLVSDYNYFTYSITPIYQITENSNAAASSACSLGVPNSVIYLGMSGATPSINDYVYTNSIQSIPFDGTRSTIFVSGGTQPRNWKIGTPTNTYYSCTINAVGKITTSPILCAAGPNSGLLSDKALTLSTSCRAVNNNNNVYWNGVLVIGTTLYKTNISGNLTNFVASGYYHILVINLDGLELEYIIQVGNSGNVLDIKGYSTVCSVGVSSGGSSGGGGGGGCVDPLVSILLPNGVTKFAGEVKVNDIILTVHDITKELGEFKVLNKEIIKQPKVIIKFTDGTEIKVSDTHKFLMSDDTWKQIFMLKGNETVKGLKNDKTIKEIIKIGEGDVVMFEIEEAHTYISDGLISHNKMFYSLSDTFVYPSLE